MPANASDELTKAVTKLAGRIPQIAALFGIEAPAQKPRGKAKRPTPPPPPQSAAPTPAPETAEAAAPAADEEE